MCLHVACNCPVWNRADSDDQTFGMPPNWSTHGRSGPVSILIYSTIHRWRTRKTSYSRAMLSLIFCIVGSQVCGTGRHQCCPLQPGTNHQLANVRSIALRILRCPRGSSTQHQTDDALFVRQHLQAGNVNSNSNFNDQPSQWMTWKL